MIPEPIKPTIKTVRLALEAAERHLNRIKAGEVTTALYRRHGIHSAGTFSNADLLREAQERVRGLKSVYERRLLESQRDKLLTR